MTEREVIGKIEILESGHIQCRYDTIIERDGQEVTRLFRREVLSPGDDVSGKPKLVRDVSKAVWTADVIHARNAQKPMLPVVTPAKSGKLSGANAQKTRKT